MAKLIAREYSRLPKFVCGTIKPMLKCCFSLSFFVVRLLDSVDKPDDVCERHPKVVTIIDINNKIASVERMAFDLAIENGRQLSWFPSNKFLFARTRLQLNYRRQLLLLAAIPSCVHNTNTIKKF